MSSEEETGITAYPDEVPEQFGRTGWDVFHSGRFWIFGTIIGVAAAALVIYAVYSGALSADSIGSFIGECWPIFIAPLVGIAMGWKTVMMLYQADARYLLYTDLGSGSLRLLQIPEKRFRMMRQAGNSFSLHSGGGRQVYLVRDFDIESGYIDYGWVHEERAEVVAVDLDAYNRWRDDLTTTKIENLQLMANPKVIAAELSKKNLKEHLDRLCKALGIGNDELDAPSENATSPETEPKEALIDDQPA